MPHLQVTPQSAMAANKLARAAAANACPGIAPKGDAGPDIALYRSQLQAAHSAAKARANKVCRNEPGVISKYALGDLIAEFELTQIMHGELGHFAESIAYNTVISRLKTLIPV